MMARTRLGIAAAVPLVASAALATAPAGAAPGSNPPASPTPTVTITNPAQASPPTVEQTSTPTISGNVQPTDTTNGTITSVQITVTSNGGHPGASFSVTPQKTQTSSGQTQWTFSGQVPSSMALAWNGAYRVTAVATESDPNRSAYQGPQSDPPRDFAEGVPPQVPTGVSAQKNANANAVTVTWQANPEPDILGYQVQRASVNGSDWSNVGSRTSDTNYRDSGVQSGRDYQYRVIAYRPGAQQNSTLASAPSSSASTVTPPLSGLFGPGGSINGIASGVQSVTDPVEGLVRPGPSGPNGPVTGSPTAGGYSNLPYNGQASLAEPGTPSAQDPKGRSSGANLLRTALFVALALILLAIAAHLIRMRRALDNQLEDVGLDSWDRHSAGAEETSEVTVVGTRGGDYEQGRSAVARAMAAQRRR